MLKKVFLEFLLGYRIISPDEDYLTEAIRILFKAGIPFRVRAGKIHLSYSVFKRAYGILDNQRIKSVSVFLGVRGFFSRLILKKGVVIGLFSIFLLTLLSSNTVFDIRVSGVENMEDFVVSNLLLPIGALIYLLFCVSKFGWGFDNYIEECNTGKGMKMPKWLKPYFQFVLPLLVLVILVTGLSAIFK